MHRVCCDWMRRICRVLAACVMVCTVAVGTSGWAGAFYIATGADGSAVELNSSEDAQAAQLTTAYVKGGGRSGPKVELVRGTTVTVERDGQVVTTASRGETIEELLERLDMSATPLEMVGIEETNGAVRLTVATEIIGYEQVTEEVAYTTRRVANPDLPEGTERVVQEGVDGERTSVYELVWSQGELISRQYVEEIDSTMVEEIVEYGTGTETVASGDTLVDVVENADGSGTLVFASGATVKFSNARRMTATAYTAGYDGVGTLTATGTRVRVGSVAVDKSVIPLGTELFIVADGGIVYGMATAEDTGVKGNKVDLYHETYEQCINFGRRDCTVYILA